MNAKDLTEFHSLVEQFQSEMSLKDICSQEGVDPQLHLMAQAERSLSRSRKATDPAIMVKVTYVLLAHTSVAINVRIGFEDGFMFDRREMEVERLIKFLDGINPVLCLG